MVRDNRQRGPGIKSVEPALTSALFRFENAARRDPGKRNSSLVSDTAPVAGCPRGRRTHRTDPSHMRNNMQFTWLLTALAATLSCMVSGATAAEASAAAEAAALQLAKKLYPTCTVSVIRVRITDRCPPLLIRSRANPPTTTSGPVALLLIFRSGPSLARVPPGTRPKICLQPHGY
jgi:hypothetical protein